MRNADQWLPSKYVVRNGRLRASWSAIHVSLGSWLITDLVAAKYGTALPEHCRGDVLDLGCGRVPLYEMYRDLAKTITCADWPASMHDICHADLLLDLDQPLPLSDAVFDTVIFSDVMEHLSNPRQAMAEIQRVLRPGGKLLMSVPFMYWIHECPNDFYRYTRFALERLVDESGLELISLQELGGAPEVLADVTAKLAMHIRFAGPALARFIQICCRWWSGTRLGSQVSSSTARHFPIEYFLVATRV